jgi:hypothetical protein
MRLRRLPFALIGQGREFSDICESRERFDGLSVWQSISYWLCCRQLIVFDRDQLFGFFPVRKLAAREYILLPAKAGMRVLSLGLQHQSSRDSSHFVLCRFCCLLS